MQVQMIDQMFLLIMVVDLNSNFEINYMNLLMIDLVQDIFEYLLVLVEELMGIFIDWFYKMLEYQW